MAAPALRVPLGFDLAEMQKNAEQASSHVAQVTKQIATQFANLNERAIAPAVAGSAAFASGWATAGLRTIATFAGVATAGVAAYKAISAAVEESRREIAEMVELADKSRQADVGSQFFQSFVAQSRQLKLEASELEQALANAFQATKLAINPDWSAYDIGLAKISAVERALQEFNLELFDASEKSQGLQIFQNAQNNEDRIRGVLTMMIDLDRIGQHAASLDLGEKMFGSQIADRIRQGSTSAQQLLDSVNRIALRSDDIFPEAMVRRAKEIDDELKKSHQTLDQALRPAWQGLTNIVLDIKSAWADVVRLAAEAVQLAGRARPSQPVSERGTGTLLDQQTSLQTRLRAGGLTSTQRGGLEQQLRDVQSQLAQADLRAGADVVQPFIDRIPGEGGVDVPLPRRRPAGLIPETKARTETARDDFDRQVESIERHIAAMKADALAVGQTEAAHATLRTELALLQAVQREGGAVTNEQIDKYTELRASMSSQQALAGAGISLNAAQAASFENVTQRMAAAATMSTRLRDNWQNLNSAVQFGGEQLVQIFDALGSKTQSWGQVMQSVFGSVKRAFLEAVVYGGGPIAGVLGLRSNVPGGTGGLLGALFGGFRAGGGDVDPGKAYMVNENTPNSEWFVPDRAGSIVPAQVMSQSFSHGGVSVTNIIDARNVDPGIEARIMSRLPGVVAAATAQAVVQVPAARRNNPDYF